MRRYIVYILLAFLMPLAVAAQSMTDDQVMAFVAKEHAAGTSNAQIVTKLMQRGVDISQIRRVRTKYESQMNQGSMSSVGSKNGSDASRMRTNNGKTRNDYGKKADAEAAEYSSQRVKAQPDRSYTHTYDDNDEEYVDFQKEMAAMVSSDKDSLAKSKNRVFGRDIFNSKLLSFEPNMNIATPQNYRLGPGDAVIIDIYGASQKTEQCTVSPDGDVTIEGYGPVQVSGLTVAQANARLRSTLGSRYTSSRVRLTVGQTRTIMVNVMGEVRLPGTYTLSAFATVFHALYMAGGTNELGTLRNIKVYRGGRLVTVVDIYDYILNGRLTGNVRLAEGDVIVVGPYDCLVNISGKVKRPMFYEMKKNESV
ncbi:polysaccharide biosynthesis/export family protein, partial [Prevotella sp.]|uniref:polysaccharide biosynthesis/export family protein n=1 Tax=Prevotella sp. TaxID=59823 RepID=UPI00307BA1CF